MKSELIKQIEQYEPFNEQEARDREIILDCLKNNEKIFSRESQMAHMTASAWVTNQDRDKILMVYHNLYDSWSWLGGHADGQEELLEVAMREVREESGLKSVTPISREIYSLEILTVDGHRKRGKYVSSHLHFNITYLLEADDKEILSIKPDENSGVAWFGLEKAVEYSSEKWFRENIYSKLNMKLQKLSAQEQKEEVSPKREEEIMPIVSVMPITSNTDITSDMDMEEKIEDKTPTQEEHERVSGDEYIEFGSDKLPVSDIKSYGISTSETKCYVKIYEQILDNHKLRKVFSSGYMWNGKKQKIDISAEEYFERAKKIARVYGYSVPTKTSLNKDGKVVMYCRKAGKLSLEEDFISCPLEYLYIETEDRQRKQFFEDESGFRIYDKLKELDTIFSKKEK